MMYFPWALYLSEMAPWYTISESVLSAVFLIWITYCNKTITCLHYFIFTHILKLSILQKFTKCFDFKISCEYALAVVGDSRQTINSLVKPCYHEPTMNQPTNHSFIPSTNSSQGYRPHSYSPKRTKLVEKWSVQALVHIFCSLYQTKSSRGM